MKLIEAVIKPAKVDAIEETLQKLGVEDILETATVCRNRLDEERTIFYRGAELANVREKIKLEISAGDGLVENIVKIIRNIAQAEQKEDCLIHIFPLDA